MTAVIPGMMVFAGCQEVPQEQIENTIAIVDSLELKGANVFAPESFQKLRDSLNNTIAQVEMEKAKFLEDYTSEIKQLEGVASFAEEVNLETAEKKEEVRNEVLTTVEEVRSLLEENNQMILQVSQSSNVMNLNNDLESLNQEQMELDSTLSETAELLSQGELQLSKERAVLARDKAVTLNNVIKEKYGAKVMIQ
ncbi:hypothetical protein [Fulvivirga sedimenti]|uniref:DUF4398 domain-containing protein n=1 Tax=Fulvivirga sedimenti TaxID=2879465 RepID=A0A9X1HTN3_9BACT|nr:hypothetical protein [Fulvivirga sedimenti]MCA6074760.1 hypothetical protein [Fulvivirga sedimenti]MCA6075937.1 hypothetical protein [Fulvivirga sedimenti]MCA6077065.1 hypothetical protein [Fulvivirga sedimenti]